MLEAAEAVSGEQCWRPPEEAAPVKVDIYFFVMIILTPSCRWVDISTWTPTPQGCLHLGPSPSVLDKSFFAESVLTSYNFLASLQIIFNLEHGKLNFLDKFLSIIYYLFS